VTPTFVIDRDLVERAIMDLGAIGAAAGTGVSRTTFSPEWVAAQDLVGQWCRDAGLAVRMDAVGNLWGRAEGSAGGKAIATGSHIDSQTPGGRYDGALGVIAGVIAARAVLEQAGAPKRPIEVVSLCEEEGSRFPTAGFWGSRGIIGAIGPDVPDQVVGYDGVTIGEAMRAVGLDPARVPEAERDDLDVFLELHIEQGPMLEQAGLPVGVVTGITGIREMRVVVHGRADHAGARPIDLRKDPMDAAAAMIRAVIGVAKELGRPAVTTVGRILVEPNFPNIVPERVEFTIDSRNPDPEARRQQYARQDALLREIAAEAGLEMEMEAFGGLDPCPCDPEVVRVLEEAARAQGVPFMAMPSGAVHDSQQLAARSRIGMIFVQSRDGRSHTPAEFSSVEHCAQGIEVLAGALYRLAY
jgi:allantoate deiminase